MADAVDTELLSTIRIVLNSVRRSLEMGFPARARGDDADVVVFKEFLLAIESVRLSFVPADRGSRASFESIQPHLIATIRELNEVLANERYRKPLLRPFRLSAIIPNRDGRRTLPGFEAKDINIGSALERLLEYASAYAVPSTSSAAVRDLFELRSLVPKQKIAPAQFEIKDSRVIVAKRASSFQEEDRASIASAKAELQRTGERVIQELERSNCDRRLLENVQQLQKLLDDETDAIKIGLANFGCELMSSSFEHELPTAVASMLKSHTRGVQLFVGQFPEWGRFLENAASVHIEASDVSAIKSASDHVVKELRSRPDLVDPEVPRTLAHLNEMLSAPATSGKRAAFAVLRSVENLISVIFTYGADFAQKTVSKTIDQASTAASKVIVGSLLAIALGGAAAIGPVAGKVPEMKWLQTATEIVRKQLQNLGDLK